MQVYLTKNLINDKKYIGKDAKSDPNYLGSGLLLKKAIKKYGKEKFEKIILVDNIICLKTLEEEEKKFILLFDAVNNKQFYNITFGGEGGDTFTNNPNKEIIRQKCKDNYRKPILTDKQRSAISDRVKKEIYQFDANGILIKKYNSLDEAVKEFKKAKGSLSRAASGKCDYWANFRWSYTNVVNPLRNNKFGRKQGTKNSYKIERNHVNVFTVPLECYENDVLINKFNNQQEAADYFNVSKENINQAIIRNQKGKLFKKKYRFIKGIKKQITQIINNE